MRSGWFWGTAKWEEYQFIYHHGQVPKVWKSSPLAHDHAFDNEQELDIAEHQTVVVDLRRTDLWSGVRKSYRPLINSALRHYDIGITPSIPTYQTLHAKANGGQPRPDGTYRCQAEWMRNGYGLLVAAFNPSAEMVAAAYWIIYCGCAYYASGPSVVKNVQHAVVWKSLEELQALGLRKVELGQIDGETEKEQHIGTFKLGWGGTVVPFWVAKEKERVAA